MSNESNTQIETKIIVTHKGNRASVGIQQANCDPVFFLVEGDILTAINRIPGLIEEAARKWQTDPRYPKTELSSSPPPQATAVTHKTPGTAANPPDKQQEAMF